MTQESFKKYTGNFVEFRSNPNYLIFEDGRVYNKKTDKYLKGFVTNDKYKRYYLYDENGKMISYLAHRLVYMHFKPYKEGMFIVHNDGDRLNNDISNLTFINQHELNKDDKPKRKPFTKEEIIKHKINNIDNSVLLLADKILNNKDSLEKAFYKEILLSIVKQNKIEEQIKDVITALELSLLKNEEQIKTDSIKRKIRRIRDRFMYGISNCL